MRRSARTGQAVEPTPSPNIWNWPEVYELENRAQDATGVLHRAVESRCDLRDRDVLDVGCGDGYHLAGLARLASSVVGVEPYAPLVTRARRRLSGLTGVEHVDVRPGAAQALPVESESMDVVHARTAYFFGPGCEPGLREVDRVLRPGGTLLVVDLDTGFSPYGDWMRADVPALDPARIEDFFAQHGFDSASVVAEWRFDDRASLQRVLGIEFSAAVAARAARSVAGTSLHVGYRVRTRQKPHGLLTNVTERS
ncbi:methyltransferase domain-containing protein [Allosaccharopolyspora coralli]|uniref:Methyltransferase domain-containing protein n=1 Tax=Allosaccharopolyspora coralli TaxID=2665642 RepID=A0A5Q3QDB1_9PSEU|nr:methyltransferase domain-containing protein [Allosaccharopolyspora coralli]QGK72363.1 methyltransferase domain-containing protein [Allosaccharopolyspora coralli]